MRQIAIEAIMTKDASNFSGIVEEMKMVHKFSNGFTTAWICGVKDVADGIDKMTKLESNGIGHKIWAFENGKLIPMNDSEKQEFGKPIYMAWKELL